MIAKLRQYRTTSKKVNLVACLIRKKPVIEAINTLNFTHKKSALALRKLLESAVQNAEHNFKQSKETLYVKEVLVSEGSTYKRSVPISRGRVHPILKRTSHIIIKLAVIEGMEVKPAKAAKKPAKAKKTETAEVETVTVTEETKPAKKARKTTKSK